MDPNQHPDPPPPRANVELEKCRAQVTLQFAAAWDVELVKANELLATVWRAPFEEALNATEERHAKQLEAFHAQQQRVTQKLAQNLRRMRQFESESQWSNVVADAAHLTAPRVIVFSINADKLKLQAARGFELAGLTDVPLIAAAAFHAAVTTSEPTVALKTKGELSEAIAERIGEDSTQRIAVYPITTRERVAAVVYAEQADAALLDLVTTAAGAALEGHMSRGPSTPTVAANLVTITPAAGTPFITRDEEERHSRAQRFARVQVAEIRLYHSQAVKTGRADSNLYRALQSQIDGVRTIYQEQYLKKAPNMTDYLHQEILRTLANGHTDLLGPDYPGPLV